LQIVSSWLDTMNEDGWIPREMILGVEAQRRVPEEFLVQRDSVANPPVFFFLISQFLDDQQVSFLFAIPPVLSCSL
jgi:mannosyl-oligosaccharide glucosidase